MVLRWSDARNCWVCSSRFEERAIPKGAGCRWDQNDKVWWTADPTVARRLAKYADARAQAHIDGAKQSVVASRADDAQIEVPVPEGREYMPFQRAGIAYAMSRPATLIGDEMGLGKTIQAIGLINADSTIQRVLIVCPLSLKLNWRDEMDRWLVRPMTIGMADAKTWPDAQIVLIHHDVLSRHMDEMRQGAWDLVVVDEAHLLKNPKAQRSVALLGGKGVAPVQARRKLALTGTPIPNRPVEIQGILAWLDNAQFGDFFRFAMRYCDATQTKFGWNFSGHSNLGELQESLRATVMVRRLKADVLAELPAKVRQVVALQVTTADQRKAVQSEREAEARHEAERAKLEKAVEIAKASADKDAYAKAVQALREAEAIAFTEMARLRHETAIAKAPDVANYAREALDGDGGRKIVLFAHHHDVIEVLRSELADYGVVVVTGETAQEDRYSAVQRFQSDASCRVFIGGIQAAGVGITLTASSHVIFAELDWVPGNMSQAEDRCHRIGQRDSVLVQHLVLDGSIDSKMAKTLLEKQAVADKALDAKVTVAS